MIKTKIKSTLYYCFTCFILAIHLSPDFNSVHAGTNTTPPPQIATAPARATLDISNGRASGSVKVFNLGNKPVSINTQISHWDLDAENNVRAIAPTSQSLDQWLIVNPLNFTIQPGKHQVVRYAIRPRTKPETGEHRAMLFFNKVNNETATETVDVNFRLGVAIYGNAGDIERTGTLHGLAVDYETGKARISADIESKGNAHVRFEGQITVWPRSAYPGASSVFPFDLSRNSVDLPSEVIGATHLTSTPVIPGTRRTVNTVLKLPETPGSYVVHINGNLGNQAVVESLALNIP